MSKEKALPKLPFTQKQLNAINLVAILILASLVGSGLIYPSTLDKAQEAANVWDALQQEINSSVSLTEKPAKWLIGKMGAYAWLANSSGVLRYWSVTYTLVANWATANSTDGGLVSIKEGDYTGMVLTLYNGNHVYIEKGATGITVALITGATCLLENWNTGLVTWYKSGLVKTIINYETGAINCTDINMTAIRVTSINETTSGGKVAVYNMVVEYGAVLPSDAVQGEIFLKTVDNYLYMYNGSGWQALGYRDYNQMANKTDLTVFLLRNGTQTLTANWDVGNFGVSGLTWLNTTSISFSGQIWWNGQNRTDSIANPTQPYSYLIDIKDGNYRMKNGTTEQIDYQSTNASKLVDFAQGNMTDGESMFVKNGTYNIGRIKITKSITIASEKGAIFKAEDTGIVNSTYTSYIDGATSTVTNYSPIIEINGASDVVISGLTIDGNPLSRGFLRHGIFVWDSKRVSISNCIIKNVEGFGIELRSSGNYLLATPEDSGLNTTGIDIRNCYVNNTISVDRAGGLKGFGINVAFSEDVLVQGCHVEYGQESAFRTHYSKNVRFLSGSVYDLTQGEPFDIYRSDHVVIDGNFVYDDGAGIYVYEYTRNIIVKNNYLYNATYPIRVQGMAGERDHPIEYITFENNYVDGAFHLINDYLKHIRIINNVITGQLKINKIGSTVTAGEDLLIEKNHLLYNGEALYVYYYPARIISNYFYNRARIGYSNTTIIENNEFTCDKTTYAMGIYIASGNLEVKIAHNYFHDITYQAIYSLCTVATDSVEISDNYFDTISTGTNVAVIQFPDGNVTKASIKGNTFNNTLGTYTINTGNNPTTIKDNTLDKTIDSDASIVWGFGNTIAGKPCEQFIANTTAADGGSQTFVLAGTPTCIFITSGNITLNVICSYGSVTATTFIYNLEDDASNPLTGQTVSVFLIYRP